MAWLVRRRDLEFHLSKTTNWVSIMHEIKRDDSNYADHHAQLTSRWRSALGRSDYDTGVIIAGSEDYHFQDDQTVSYKPNPYLVQWLSPEYCSPGSVLVIKPDDHPIYYMNRPVDYWHAPSRTPEPFKDFIEIKEFEEEDSLRHELQRDLKGQRAACIGPTEEKNDFWGTINPETVVNQLHFTRAIKTKYEIELIRIASSIGARGHNAAKRAFDEGHSEFGIHMAYLAASAQNESQLPYPNIIGINENAGILHYQHQERTKPELIHSLLIDAGGSHQGYASDITRSYSSHSGPSIFNDLLNAMQRHQDDLIASVEVGGDFLKLHEQMHRQLNKILVESSLLNCSLDEASSIRASEYFCPHGLGHLLGIQVHDVGGLQIDANGNNLNPPEHYSSLRFTRPIEEDQIFTIEPGIYFIPMLLDKLKKHSKLINWNAIEELLPYGGIRIEDNVRVLPTGVENLTREAFDKVKLEG